MQYTTKTINILQIYDRVNSNAWRNTLCVRAQVLNVRVLPSKAVVELEESNKFSNMTRIYKLIHVVAKI